MIDKILNKLLWKVRYYKNRVYQRIKYRALVWALKTPYRSIIYYVLFDRSFDRELHSVLNGKYVHNSGVMNSLAFDATLRRNIHRIEKGLINNPLKPAFALDYIYETVSAFEKMLTYNDVTTLKWAGDVLSTYFDSVKSEKVDKARQRFEYLIKSHASLFKSAISLSIPYARKEAVFSSIEYDEFYKLCLQRRSIRWYKSNPVPVEIVKKAIEAAILSPSACNRQPFRFILVDDPQTVKVVSRIPGGTDMFADNIPFIVAIIGDLSAYFDERDRHIIYIDGSLAAMSFMLALETLGLSSCPINWPDVEQREKLLAETFNLSSHERCVMFISVGYALEEGKIPYSQKKPIESIIDRNPGFKR